MVHAKGRFCVVVGGYKMHDDVVCGSCAFECVFYGSSAGSVMVGYRENFVVRDALDKTSSSGDFPWVFI